MKNQKGITLIALVITIIVLLILAGVAIAMLSGENGILKKASDSAEETAVSNAKEQIGLIATEAITEYYDSVYVDGNVTTQGLGVQAAVINAIAELKTDEYDDVTLTLPTTVTAKPTADNTELKIKFDGNGHEYTSKIDTNGKLTWDKMTFAD